MIISNKENPCTMQDNKQYNAYINDKDYPLNNQNQSYNGRRVLKTSVTRENLGEINRLTKTRFQKPECHNHNIQQVSQRSIQMNNRSSLGGSRKSNKIQNELSEDKKVVNGMESNVYSGIRSRNPLAGIPLAHHNSFNIGIKQNNFVEKQSKLSSSIHAFNSNFDNAVPNNQLNIPPMPPSISASRNQTPNKLKMFRQSVKNCRSQYKDMSIMSFPLLEKHMKTNPNYFNERKERQYLSDIMTHLLKQSTAFHNHANNIKNLITEQSCLNDNMRAI